MPASRRRATLSRRESASMVQPPASMARATSGSPQHALRHAGDLDAVSRAELGHRRRVGADAFAVDLDPHDGAILLAVVPAAIAPPPTLLYDAAARGATAVDFAGHRERQRLRARAARLRPSRRDVESPRRPAASRPLEAAASVTDSTPTAKTARPPLVWRPSGHPAGAQRRRRAASARGGRRPARK